MRAADTPCVLLATGFRPPHLLDRLQQRFEVLVPEAGDMGGSIRSHGDRIRAVVGSGGRGLSAEELASLPKLEIVALLGLGLDTMDMGEARARGVAVTDTPVIAADVADMAMGLWFAAARRIAHLDRFVREGCWATAGRPGPFHRVTGKRVGVFGLGRIGSAIAARAAPFASEVLYAQRHPAPDTPYSYRPDILSLARDSDVLFLAAPGGPGTRRIADAAVFAALGPQGVIVNIARGSLLDEAALVDALRAGRLGAAGLDVFEHEPRPSEALFQMDQVVLTPHSAGLTLEAQAEMLDQLIANLEAHFTGRPLVSPVR